MLQVVESYIDTIAETYLIGNFYESILIGQTVILLAMLNSSS